MGKTPSTLINTEDPAAPEDESATKNNTSDSSITTEETIQNPVKEKTVIEEPIPVSEPQAQASDSASDFYVAEADSPVPITIYEYKKGKETVGTDELPAGTIVVPRYVRGEDGGQAIGSSDLTFQLEVQDGWVAWSETAASASVQYRIQKPDSNAEGGISWLPTGPDGWADVPCNSGTYTITVNGDNGKSGNERKKCFTGPIEIRVVAAQNPAVLDVSAFTDGAYFVENGSKGDVFKGTKSDMDFAKFTQEVTLLVKAGAHDIVQMYVKNTGGGTPATGTPRPMTRGATGEDGWTEFSIDPRTLPGFENHSTVSGVTFVVDKATETRTFTYVLGTGDFAFDEIPAADLSGKFNTADATAAKLNYFTVSKSGSTVSAPDATNKSNYLETSQKRNILVFKAAATSGVADLLGVKAELTDTNKGDKLLQTINATEKSYKNGSGDVTYYEIDLGDVDADLITGPVKFTLKADTALKNEKDSFSNHRITFRGDLENVEIKEQVSGGGGVSTSADFDVKTKAKALDTSFDTKEATLDLVIRPKEGYDIAHGTDYGAADTASSRVVTVSYTKEYQLTYVAKPSVGDSYAKKSDSVSKRFTGEDAVELKLEDVNSSTKAGVYKLADASPWVSSNKLNLIDSTTGDSDWKALATASGRTLADYTQDTGGNAHFSYKDIVIEIKTTSKGGRSGSFTVESKDLEYTVRTENGVKESGKAGEYEISEEADFVVIDVVSPGGAPKVTYENASSGTDTLTGKNMTKDGDVWTVKIPVGKMKGYNGSDIDSNIDSKIKIEKDVYELTIETDGTEDSFGGLVRVGDGNPKKYGDTAEKRRITEGNTVPVTLYAPDGTEFKTVKVAYGEALPNQRVDEVTLGEDKSKIDLNLTMTDNVEIVVTTSNIYYINLTRDPSNTRIPRGEDGVYAIPAGSKNIKAELKEGTTLKTIAYARLYDGGREAASTVALSGTVATIASISERDTGLLRLELGVKIGNKIKAVSVQIRQDGMASRMAITDSASGAAVSAFEQAPDTPTVEYNVRSEEGTLTFTDGDIGLELATDATRINGVPAAWNDADAPNAYLIDNSDVKVVFDPSKKEKQLEITAKPSVSGNKSYVLRFYDKEKRAKAASTGAADRICAVEGGSLDVRISAPSVANANFQARALAATNTTLRIQVESDEVNLNSANKNGVFYRVTLGSGDKIGSGVDKNGKAITRGPVYYEVDYGVSGSSQILEYQVNPEKNSKEEDFSDPQTFHPVVELVQTTECLGVAPDKEEAERQGNRSKLAKSAAVSLVTATKEARYESELVLSPAKANVYIGQADTPATTVQFGDKTGFAEVDGGKLRFINTKTGRIVDSEVRLRASLDPKQDGVILIGADAQSLTNAYYKENAAFYKDLGLQINAVTNASGAKPASAILELDVVAGVGSITFENGNIQNLFKQPGKAATIKIAPVINGGVKENAPKVKKFVYALGDRSGKLPGESGYETLPAALQGALKLNAKNGSVTVDKNFEPDQKIANNNRFSIVVREQYSGARNEVLVTVTGQAQTVGKIVIVDENGRVVAANGALRADDFYNGGGKRGLYVRALSSNAGTKLVYDAVGDGYAACDDYLSGVRYTSSAKSVLAVDPTNGRLTLLAASKKPVKLTVASADGGKDKGQSVTLSVESYSDVALRMKGNEVGVDTTGKEKTELVKHNGAANAQLALKPVVKVNGQWVDAPSEYFKNFSIKIKKAKAEKLPKTASYWSIIKTGEVAEVAISDKTNKGVGSSYRIEQSPAAPVGAKALKIRSLTKLTEAMLDSARGAKEHKEGVIGLKYEFTGASKGVYAGQWIMLTPNFSKTKKVLDQEEWQRAKTNFLGNENAKIIKIEKDNSFVIELDVWQKTLEDLIPGDYTLVATAGTYRNGGFVPASKSADLKVKIPGKAPKDTGVKLNGAYTLDESGVAVSFNTGVDSGLSWTLESGSAGQRAMNVVDPETGKPNKFTTFFEVKDVTSGVTKDRNGNQLYTIGMKAGNKAEEIAKLRDNPKDCEGYVVVKTKNQRQEMLVKVTLGDSTIKGVAKPSYKGASATVEFFAGETPIKVSHAYIDQTASQGSPTYVKTAAPHVEDDGTVKINLNKTEKNNNYEVVFKVLAKYSAYGASDATSKNDEYIKKYGRTVKATFHIADPAGAGGAVRFEAVDEKTGLAFTAFSGDTYNKTTGIYSLGLQKKSEIDGAVFGSIGVGKKNADGSAFAGAGMIRVVEKDKTKGLYSLTLDRTAFLKVADSASPALQRGATVDVPVDVTYTNREIPAETIYVPVTLPNPMSAGVADTKLKSAVTEAKGVKVIDLQNKTAGGNVMGALQKKVNEILIGAVPLDAEAETSLPIELDAKTDPDSGVTTWEGEVWIKNKKTDKDPIWSETLKFAEEYEMLSAAVVADRIKTLRITEAALQSDAKRIVDNDYSEEALKTDILKLLAVQPAEADRIKGLAVNLSLVVKNFKIRKATASDAGFVKADISVYDSIEKKETYAISIGNSTEGYEPKLKIDIAKLGSIKENANDIESAIADNAATGLDYQTIIYSILAKGGDLQDVETTLVKAILERANGAIRHSGMSVEFNPIKITAQDVTDGTYDNGGLAAAGDSREVAFKLPTGVADGEVHFKLKVKQDGIKDYIINRSGKTDKITIDRLRKVGDVAGVKVFQTRSEAINVINNDSTGPLFDNTGTLVNPEKNVKIAIAKTSIGEIEKEIGKRVEKSITGVGLKVEVTVTRVNKAQNGTNELKDYTLGGTEKLWAHGTIKISDSLRKDATEPDPRFVVEIPAQGDVEEVSTWAELEKALEATSGASFIRLKNNIEHTDGAWGAVAYVDKTLDLNGYEIKANTTRGNWVFNVGQGSRNSVRKLEVTGGGKISLGNTAAFWVEGNGDLTIDGVSIEGGDKDGWAIGMSAKDADARLTFRNSSILKGGISTNGTNGWKNYYVTIEDSTITSNTIHEEDVEKDTAIYLPGSGAAVIRNSIVTGYCEGIEVRGGTLDVTGGSVSATNESFVSTPGSGHTTMHGVALGIGAYAGKGKRNVTLSNCTIDAKSGVAIAVSKEWSDQIKSESDGKMTMSGVGLDRYILAVDKNVLPSGYQSACVEWNGVNFAGDDWTKLQYDLNNSENGRVALTKDLEVDVVSTIVVDNKEVELDLNGHSIVGEKKDALRSMFKVKNGGSLSIVGNGTIEAKSGLDDVIRVVGDNLEGKPKSRLLVGKDVELVARNCPVLRISTDLAYNSTGEGYCDVAIEGTLTDYSHNAIHVDGLLTKEESINRNVLTLKGATINVYGELSSADGVGIYQAGAGTTTITGGSINLSGNAESDIDVRGGTLILEGATLDGERNKTEVGKNEPGDAASVVTGALIGVSRHSHGLPIKVTVDENTVFSGNDIGASVYVVKHGTFKNGSMTVDLGDRDLVIGDKGRNTLKMDEFEEGDNIVVKWKEGEYKKYQKDKGEEGTTPEDPESNES